MGSNSNSPTSDHDEAKGAFRKPSNDAGSRKYRRHSSASPSASQDESPKQDLRSSPALLKEDKRRKHSTRDDRVSGRGDNEHDSDSRRYSSKGSQDYNRSSDHTRGGKDVDEEDKSSTRISSRSGRESRGGDYNRSRDYYHHRDKYNRDRSDTTERASRDKYGDRDRRGRDRDYRDEKRDYGRSSRDYKSDHITSREESRRNQDDSISRRESNSQKEADKDDAKAEVRSKHLNEENKRRDEGDCKESRGRFQDDPANRNEENTFKRPKLSGFDNNDPTRGSDQGHHLAKDTPGQPVVNMPGSAGNVDAAKVAAMKAAELVNKNLGSTGVMTADQKKKLLWGNKKNTSTEESSSHRWDSAIFPDRERQEKFNKLMGVKGEVKLAQDPSSGDPVLTDKQRELQMDLEKQYTAGLRRRDGRTVGLGL